MAKKQTKQPDPSAEWENNEGPSGWEGTDPSDLGIPFLTICQDMSPEFKKSHKDYQKKKIEGIAPGMVFNTLTREIVYKGQDEDKPFLFIPCWAEKMYPEFRTRNNGGGFIQMHAEPTILQRCKRNDNNQDIIVEGDGKDNEIVTTHYIGGLVEIEGNWEKAVIGMKSTQLQNARRWLNMARAIKLGPNRVTPPLYSHTYKLSTGIETKAENSYFGWLIEKGDLLSPVDEIVIEAKALTVDYTEQKVLPPPPPDQD